MTIRKIRRSTRKLFGLALGFTAVFVTYNYVWVFKEPAASPERSVVNNAFEPQPFKPGERVDPLAAALVIRNPDSITVGSQRNAASRVKSSSQEVVARPSQALCPQMSRPAVVMDKQTFKLVDGDATMYVFSAFLDEDEDVVRVVGLFERQFVTSLVCNLWFDSPTDDLALVQAKILQLQEHHEKRYTAVYVTCPVTGQRSPYAVALTLKNCSSIPSIASIPTNLLPVLTFRQKYNFTVCVTALNFKYSRAYELVEMIELNRLLGADNFVFYVNSVGDNVHSVLRWYSARGLVDLIDWKLPMRTDHWPPAKEEAEVHYFGQVASHNDCLNRYRGSSRFLVYQDLDEFIIPKKRTTWRELIADVDKNNGRSSSAYIVRCVFFRKDWPSNSENYTGRATAEKFRSVVLSTDKRQRDIFSISQRSKYIVDPKKVQEVGIHDVRSYRGEAHQAPLSPEDALLHHYRNWENPSDSNMAVRDTDMYRFKDKLLERLTERWQELPNVPLDIDISTYGIV